MVKTCTRSLRLRETVSQFKGLTSVTANKKCHFRDFVLPRCVWDSTSVARRCLAKQLCRIVWGKPSQCPLSKRTFKSSAREFFSWKFWKVKKAIIMRVIFLKYIFYCHLPTERLPLFSIMGRRAGGEAVLAPLSSRNIKINISIT